MTSVTASWCYRLCPFMGSKPRAIDQTGAAFRAYLRVSGQFDRIATRVSPSRYAGEMKKSAQLKHLASSIVALSATCGQWFASDNV